MKTATSQEDSSFSVIQHGKQIHKRESKFATSSQSIAPENASHDNAWG